MPVRHRLEQILSRGIAVGSGCVIDSYGNVSRQQDVVLYEREICPVFSINDTPEARYCPCEGVIAVGEVNCPPKSDPESMLGVCPIGLAPHREPADSKQMSLARPSLATYNLVGPTTAQTD